MKNLIGVTKGGPHDYGVVSEMLVVVIDFRNTFYTRIFGSGISLLKFISDIYYY
jgi:hypothetical protein